MAIPYFQFYPSDWRSDPKVALLSLEERGAYIEVLCLMWEMGDDRGRLIDNDELIARQLHLNVTRWRRLKAGLSTGDNAVLTIEDGKISQKRLEKEKGKAVEKSAKTRDSVDERWEKKRQSERKDGYERKENVPLRARVPEPEPDNTPLPPKGGKAQASRIEPDWKPEGAWEWSLRTFPDIPKSEMFAVLKVALPEFVDYWLGVPGPKGMKADWNATFRNWMRRKHRDGELRVKSARTVEFDPSYGGAVITGVRILN